MKKIIVVIAILAMLLTSGCGLLELGEPTTFEKDSYTIDLPAGFYDDGEGAYIKDSTSMLVESRYYLNELDMDIDAFSRAILYTEYYVDDIIEIEEVEIDGHDAIQAQYKTLSTGRDDIHYYYFGIMTMIKLDTVVLVVDSYVAKEEPEGINSDMSDSDKETLLEIASTIKITDEGYDDHYASPEKIDAGGYTLNLSDNWMEATEGENGFYDFGYYSLFASLETYMYYEFDVYNDENANDLEYIAEDAKSYDEYTYVGRDSIVGETADLYKYDAFDAGDGAYIYGVIAASEHYWVELYFYTYDDDFTLSDETVENVLDYILNIQ